MLVLWAIVTVIHSLTIIDTLYHTLIGMIITAKGHFQQFAHLNHFRHTQLQEHKIFLKSILYKTCTYIHNCVIKRCKQITFACKHHAESSRGTYLACLLRHLPQCMWWLRGACKWMTVHVSETVLMHGTCETIHAKIVRLALSTIIL